MLILIGLFLGTVTSAWSSDHLTTTVKSSLIEQTKPNCLFTITTAQKNGSQNFRVFKNHTASKTECDALAKKHRENFAPHVVVKKKVQAKWFP